MRRPIPVGLVFEIRTGTGRAACVNRYRREPDDDDESLFGCERIRLTHMSSTMAPGMLPYSFGTEPEWFSQRGLEAVS
jgi:hypothetical protein